MQKIVIASIFIISIAALLHSLIIAILIEEKPADSENKRAEKISNTIQKGAIRLFSESHQQVFFLSAVSVIVFLLSPVGAKSAAAFVLGAIIALVIEKIAVRIISALLLRIAPEYEKGRKFGIGAVLASSSVIYVFSAGIALLAAGISFSIVKDVDLLLPFALGISAMAAFLRIFSGIFQKGLKAEAGRFKQISQNADVVSGGVEFAQNMLLIFGAAAVIASLIPAGAGGRAAILPLALFGEAAAILLINVCAFKFFKEMENVSQKTSIMFLISAILALAGAFFIVKTLIGSIQPFWPIAIGAGLAFVLELSRKNIGNPWKLSAYLGFIYFALAIAFKFDGINALALAAIGYILASSAAFANNFAAGVADNCAEAADNLTIKNDLKERMSALSFEKNRQILFESSMMAALVLFVFLSREANIRFISIGAGRALFALLAGGLISVFSMEFKKDAVEKIKGKLSAQDADVLESGSFKILFQEISRIVSRSGLIIIAATVIAPVFLAIALGVHALIAFLAGMIITAFALRESETIAAIKLLLILAIVILPVL